MVGAGIVGASITYHLARRGAEVTLFDAGQPAGGVTGAAFGWINGTHGAFGASAPLRQLAGEDWRRIGRDLGGALDVWWCGALSWQPTPAETEDFVRARIADGYDVRLVGGAELAALEPGLLDPPACAAYAERDGVTVPAAATKAMVEAACHAGARLRAGARDVTLATRGGQVIGVRTREGVVATDLVVIAAGVGAVALCQPVGVHLAVVSSPALLLRFGTRAPLVHRIVSAPDLEVRQAGATVLLAAADPADAASAGEATRAAERTRAGIERWLRGGQRAVVEGVTVGVRPMPADGLPIVGPARAVNGLYVAVLHSGVTLAPTVGRLAADEILDDAPSPLLEPCRPGRFDAPRGPPGT